MSLPKISSPLFPIKIPSTGEEFMFRPFLVAEEKILLIGQQSGDERDITTAIKQIINNCVQGDLRIQDMPNFDLEYVFLKLRAQSVSNMVNIVYSDPSDNSEAEISINLNDVNVDMPKEPINPVVFIDEPAGFGLKLKFPSVDESIAFKDPELDAARSLTMILEACIEEVFTADDVLEFKSYKPAEQLEFIDTIPVPVFTKIQEFYDSMPVLRHTVTFKPKDKEAKKITLEGLNDFFSWG